METLGSQPWRQQKWWTRGWFGASNHEFRQVTQKKGGFLAEMERVGSQNRSAIVAELSDMDDGARYAPDDRRKTGVKGQYWNGSVPRCRVARLYANPSVKNGHTLSVFHLSSPWASTKSIRASMQRGTNSVVIGFRNDPLCGGAARVVSMPDASTSVSFLSDCMPDKFPGMARSNCPSGIHATIYPGFRYGNTTSAVSCCVEPWKHSCGL